MKLIITDAAEQDLADISNWIGQDDAVRAEAFVREILQTARRLLDAPRGYPRLRRFPNREIRRRSHGQYLLVYEIDDDVLRLLHVVHGARDYHSLLDAEFAEG